MTRLSIYGVLFLCLFCSPAIVVAQEQNVVVPTEEEVEEDEKFTNDAQAVADKIFKIWYGRTPAEDQKYAAKLAEKFREETDAWMAQAKDSAYLTRFVLEASKGSPYWKVTQKLDPKTGLITVSVICTAEKPIFVDIESEFPNDFKTTGSRPWLGGLPSWFSIEYIKEQNEPQESVDKKNAIIAPLNRRDDQYVSITGVFPNKKALRYIRLEKGETFSKEFYIWDICKWDELSAILSSNRTLHLRFCKSISAIIDESIFVQSAYLPIDYQLFKRMDRLKQLKELGEKE
jgi:hypothetical protein